MIPPEDNVLPNRPPRIREDQVKPLSGFLKAPLGCSLALAAPVEDLDRDRLYVRWFVDPHLSGAPVTVGTEYSVVPGDGGVIWATLNESLDTAPPQLAVVKEHVVELLVADGALNGRVPVPRDGTGVPTYVDTYRFIVRVEEKGVCPGD